jgi:hypothetical protein
MIPWLVRSGTLAGSRQYRSDGGTHVVESMQGPIASIDVTRFSAEQWKSRAMYEEACKLQAERSLRAARDLLEDALFAAASSATLPGAV